ncbi:Acidic leucine-rich nuclear phosphoprotein 32 like protein, partial [Aduncisulcus paluster]
MIPSISCNSLHFPPLSSSDYDVSLLSPEEIQTLESSKDHNYLDHHKYQSYDDIIDLESNSLHDDRLFLSFYDDNSNIFELNVAILSVSTVTFEDTNVESLMCSALSLDCPGGNDSLSEFDIASIDGVFDANNASLGDNISGLELLINIESLVLTDNSGIISIENTVSSLNQLTDLFLDTTDENVFMNISDISPSLLHLTRLNTISLPNNPNVYDISVIFRNISMTNLNIADTASVGNIFIPLCRSESDEEYWSFIVSVFPHHDTTPLSKNTKYLPNNCPLNLNDDSNCQGESDCPSVVLNEVYNSIADSPVKECAFIAKKGPNGECYTIHDDNIRAVLSDENNVCLSSSDIETNGVISVATLRSSMNCSVLYLAAIVGVRSLSSVNDITTLQGLEYAQGTDSSNNPVGLTTLNIDGYDLSGDVNENAEYDKLVVQILAKAVTDSNINSGLTQLFASGCGLSDVSDVLDLTPIADTFSSTKPFKLTTLDLSNNSISDVSVLITSSMFPDDTDAVLTTLDISDNNICDIEGMVSALETHFSSASISITYSDQTCNCSASVSSANHQVCREVYPNRWAVECWNGYYLDKASGECVAACDSGYEYDTTTETCVSSSSSIDDAIRIQVCERHSNMKPVLEVGATSITCGCRSAWYGDDCDQLYQVYIPDELFRGKICDAAGYDIIADPLCDVTEFEMAEITGMLDLHENHVNSFEGAEFLINIYYFIGADTDVTHANVLAPLGQIEVLMLYQTLTNYGINIIDGFSLSALHRLNTLAIYGNEEMYDISWTFRNIGMSSLNISNTNCLSLIPLCRSEYDTEYLNFLRVVFPTHSNSSDDLDDYMANSCSLNDGSVSGNIYTCNPENKPNCPSIIRNEVYNSVDEVNAKQCAFIAKAEADGKCYTIHDGTVRQYLKDNCLSTSNIVDGIISVGALRSVLACSSSSLSLPAIVSATSLTSVNDITTLQGLEYATSLTSLALDGYDLSGDVNPNAEYDKLVVQILAKAVTYSNDYGVIDSGLTSLSASGCGLSDVSDVLDLTPIVEGDDATKPFKLTSLDLSNNSISDVSVLITSSMFPVDKLTSLNISGNSICDIDNVVSMLQSYFTNLSSIASHDQSTCPCSDSEFGTDVSFSAHKTCRQRSDGEFQVECWHGYFLDKNTNTCVKATTIEESIRCQVCERKDDVVAVYDSSSSSVLCGSPCASGWYGEDCSSECPIVDGETCRQRSDGEFQVECWHGYFLDKNTNTCVKATTIEESIRCQVCERKDDVVAVYDSSSSSVLCGSPCASGWYGEDCSSECPIVDGEVCSGRGSCNSTEHVCECDTWYGDVSCSSHVPVYSPECSRTFTIDDHMTCNELYPGRYAAECNAGYYYDQGEYICVEDSNTDCPNDMNSHQMCVKTSGDNIASDCRSAWYGDDCDQLYQVYIPDALFREKVCYDVGYTSDPQCDVTEFEMATLALSTGSLHHNDSNITSFEGVEYFINIYYISGKNTDVTAINSLSSLGQLTYIFISKSDSDYRLDIYDINSLYKLHRLSIFYISGNERIYDISESFRNAGMLGFSIADLNASAFIPLCRSESDDDYWTFISTIFPVHDATQLSLDSYYIPNSCPLNGLSGDYFCDPTTYPTQCPSIVLNEVYNSVDGVNKKQCAFIAKDADDGNCYTIHDESVREYLVGNCLEESDIESNGIISVATMRSVLSCPLDDVSSESSLSLQDIILTSSLSLLSVNSITTLQGLEYATSLKSLNIDGYDLSGDVNPNAEYDKLVVQILAKAVTYLNDSGSIDSGLTSLSASGCGLRDVSDVLDLTSIADVNGDPTTDKFKLTSLDLSNNSISDVSVLITSSMFPDDTDAVLTTLDISDNNICDIEGMVSALETHFSSASISITYSDQTCNCSASVSSANHQVCREVYPNRWAVECWNGYYLDKASGECVAACDSGYEYDTTTETCVSSSSSIDDAIRIQVCERHSNMKPVLEVGATSITCGCRSAWYGDDCDQLYQVYIPDELFRGKICDAAGYDIIADPLCDVTEFEMAGISETFYAEDSHITSFEGVEFLINIEQFSSYNVDISRVIDLSVIGQVYNLFIALEIDSYSPNIYDFNSLLTFTRLRDCRIYGNENFYDISVMFRNLAMSGLMIADTHYTISRIPFCRKESDAIYTSYLSSLFPNHTTDETNLSVYILPNSCSLNVGDYYCDSSNPLCPSIVLNEVYNSVDGVNKKQCAFIAKEGINGECYTVHDDNIRAFLSEPSNGCLSSSDIETNGVISVATLRSSLRCSSLNLSAIARTFTIPYVSSLSVNDITTLQGLEYAQGTDSSNNPIGLTTLNIDGYDLSGDVNENAEYDKLVVQILAKGITFTGGYGNIDSGLRSLSASGCGLSDVSDILDLTPIVYNDPHTTPFKLTTLDISNNNISDVSVLITSSMFPNDTNAILTSLDISGNSICDIEGMVNELQSKFPSLSSITYSDQTCHCSASVSSANHQVCREVYPNRWAVECWNGYYLDKASGECLEVSASGSELDTSSGTPPYTCITAASGVDDSIRVQVCERHSNMMAVLEVSASSITCGCRSAWYGDDCDELYQVYIPDELFRGKVCDAAGYDITVDTLCDVSEFEMAGINGYFYSYGSHITSIEGAQLAIYGNEQIYDISVSFRNVGLYQMYIARASHSAYTPLCRSEDDTDYWTFITTVFPIHSSDNKDNDFIPNSCSLNNDDDYVCDSETYPTQCPSIVLNEVFNSVDGVNEKQCAFIAKEGSSGECYTVHDEYIRQYLVANCLPGGTNDLDSGIISVATMRSVLSCPLDTNSNESLSLPDIAFAASLSSLNSITTLQGLEYATSLTSLTLDGYDLRGDINSNAEYDKLVVQILAKAVTSGTIDSGLRILSASGCGLSAISDVLDLTPIASGDSTTDQFKLTSLDLSNNSISDVSVLITSSIFPNNFLTTLDISDNNICDIEGIVSQLQTEFPTLSSITYSDQTCNCSASVSSANHQVCREVYPNRWAVECWNG